MTREARLMSGIILNTVPTIKYDGYFLLTSLMNKGSGYLAVITAADIAQPGTVLVSVFNPPEGSVTSVSGAIGMTSATACGGKTSNAVSFTVKP